MNKWFIFYQSELILTAENEIPVGEVPPFPLEPWHRRQTLPSLEGTACVAVEIDHPISPDTGFHQLALRQSFEVLSRADYRMAGKRVSYFIGTAARIIVDRVELRSNHIPIFRRSARNANESIGLRRVPL